MRYLGIDYGTKRVGLALSDERGSMAFPLTTIPAGEGLVDALVILVAEKKVDRVVLGESNDFSGKPNALKAHTDALKSALEGLGISVVYEPELLTSMQAARGAQNARLRTHKVAREQIDASAAALILQGYLDRIA